MERLLEQYPIGTAFYYCQYQSPASQDPFNVLGWWIVSLASQQISCLEKVRTFYAQYHPPNKPSRKPTLAELEDLLVKLSKEFTQVTLVLDGLDECGVSAGIDRSELVSSLARLRSPDGISARMLVASRQLHDIEIQFSEFDRFDLAARSSDLRMYVTAEIYRRSTKFRFQDEMFKTEMIQALVEGSKGM